jgi:hypothetical protein
MQKQKTTTSGSTKQTTSLLPIPVNQANSTGQQAIPPHRAGAAIQIDEFNRFVGRAVSFLGIVANVIEVGTSSSAIMNRFLHNPGPNNPGFWPKMGLALFVALCFQSAMWLLVVNLNDSWVSILSGHPEEVFVSRGETNWHRLMLLAFEFGGAAIDGICDVIFLGSITSDWFVIGITTTALILGTILLWPLGWKLARHAGRRIKEARRVEEARRAQRAKSGYSVVVEAAPNPSTSLTRYQR